MTIMMYVLYKGIIDINIGDMDRYAYLNNKAQMARVSDGFQKRSNGLLAAAIGAIDGWFVKITRPSKRLDNIKKCCGCISRKGFYTLNLQCIVDHDKKVLWASYDNRGGSHNSSAF